MEVGGNWEQTDILLFFNDSKYMDATTVTTIDSTMAPLTDVRFPSIYICNINQVTTEKIRRLH